MISSPLVLIHGAFSHPGHLQAWRQAFTDAGYACHAPALPGHGPGTADAALAGLTLADYRSALAGFIENLGPPVLIGHSMGGLLAQQLAAVSPCRALVCVASAPPFMLTPQLRALPALLPMLPKVLAGKPLRATAAALRQHVLHDLAVDEQDRLLPTFGPESGLAYRQLLVGATRLPGPPFRGPVLCLSGADDHLIANRTSKAIAEIYAARHERFEGHGHFLIAPSRAAAIAPVILEWLRGL